MFSAARALLAMEGLDSRKHYGKRNAAKT